MERELEVAKKLTGVCSGKRRRCLGAKAQLNKALAVVRRTVGREKRGISAPCGAALGRLLMDARDRLGC